MGGARLAARRAVVDALADQPVEAVDREATPGDAGGEDDGPRPDARRRRGRLARVAGSMPATERVTRISAPEPPRLLERAARELVARDAAREAEIVLDPRGRPGLTAGRLALDHDGAQSLGRAVDRRREAGRPAADDDGVVLFRPGAVCRPRRSARSRGFGWTSTVPSASRSTGQSSSAGRRRASASQLRRVRRHPVEGDLVAREELAQLGAGGSQRWPTIVTRGLGASAAMPCRPSTRCAVLGDAHRLARSPARPPRSRSTAGDPRA